MESQSTNQGVSREHAKEVIGLPRGLEGNTGKPLDPAICALLCELAANHFPYEEAQIIPHADGGGCLIGFMEDCEIEVLINSVDTYEGIITVILDSSPCACIKRGLIFDIAVESQHTMIQELSVLGKRIERMRAVTAGL